MGPQQASIIGRDARGVPDLSWNAAVNGGVLVWMTAFPSYQRSGWHVYGGASAASPQVAGLIALANEQQAAAGEPPLGFVNPTSISTRRWTSWSARLRSSGPDTVS